MVQKSFWCRLNCCRTKIIVVNPSILYAFLINCFDDGFFGSWTKITENANLKSTCRECLMAESSYHMKYKNINKVYK